MRLANVKKNLFISSNNAEKYRLMTKPIIMTVASASDEASTIDVLVRAFVSSATAVI